MVRPMGQNGHSRGTAAWQRSARRERDMELLPVLLIVALVVAFGNPKVRRTTLRAALVIGVLYMVAAAPQESAEMTRGAIQTAGNALSGLAQAFRAFVTA